MNLEYVNTIDGNLIVKLSGEMDALGCSRIRPELEHITKEEYTNNVTLDLRQISFLDSSGIGAIVFLFKRLKTQGRSLEIIGVQGQPQELMTLLRIDSAIPVNVASNTSLLSDDTKCAI